MTPTTDSDRSEELPGHLCWLQPRQWALWRDVGVRAPGFPVSGLDAFGGPDEAIRLGEVARDPRFLEAVTWQNRAALRNAIAKVGDGIRQNSTARRRLDVVARYWQRYCSKNETIGFFGPMGWGTVVDTPVPVVQRPGPGLLDERRVRFEVWAIQALADALVKEPELRRWLPPRRRPDRRPCHLSREEAVVYGACDGRTPAWQTGDLAVLESLTEGGLVQWDLSVALGPHPERHLRAQLQRVGDDVVRAEAISVLCELDQSRADVVAAAGDHVELERALDHLDERFVELTGASPAHAPGETYGARTVCYEDCRRDHTIEFGDPLREALAEALLPLLPGARWYCGEVATVARRIMGDALASVRSELGQGIVPATEVWQRTTAQLVAHQPELLERQRELQRRFARLFAGGTDGLAERAKAAFDDARPGWRDAVYMSPDVQIAAASTEAICAGDFSLVVGDFHPGTMLMEQSFILEQHPDPAHLRRLVVADVEPPRVFPVPSPLLPRMSGRTFPGVALADDLCLLTGPDTYMPEAYHTVHLADLVVADAEEGPVLATCDRAVEAPLEDAFWLHGFLPVLWDYTPFPPAPHVERLTVGRAVLRRETWDVPAGAIEWAFPPATAGKGEARAWAEGEGMPRRVFALAPGEIKPLYIDFESRSLTRVLARLVRHTAEAQGREETLRFTEMLPTPDQTWLLDADGNSYTSELRLVVVDMTRWPSLSRVRTPWASSKQ